MRPSPPAVRLAGAERARLQSGEGVLQQSSVARSLLPMALPWLVLVAARL